MCLASDLSVSCWFAVQSICTVLSVTPKNSYCMSLNTLENHCQLTDSFNCNKIGRLLETLNRKTRIKQILNMGVFVAPLQ